MYEREEKIMTKAIKKLGKIFLEGAGEKFSKGSHDYVTDKDLQIEEELIKIIKKYFPKDNIVSEETNNNNNLVGRTWVIDPIDGTLNYMFGLAECGIQVAFYAQDETQLAFVFLPKLNEFYFAKNGCGAFLNGKQIVVNKNLDLCDCMLSIDDFDYTVLDSKTRANIFKKLLRERVFGASCFEFVKTADSSLAAYLLITNKVWDFLPGMLICKEAGCDCHSGEVNGITYNLAACNENLSKFILREIKKIEK